MVNRLDNKDFITQDSHDISTLIMWEYKLLPSKEEKEKKGFASTL